MKRYVYFLLVAVVLAVGALIFAYKTEAPLATAEPVAEFGGVSLRLDLATTTEARERGLGGRVSIPEGYGMLFAFPKDDRYGFWMKDMLVPIDMFWLDDKGQVVSFDQDVATSTYPHVLYPSALARYVLETAAGFAARHSVATGTALLLKSPLPVLQ